MPQDRDLCSDNPLEIRFREQLLHIWPSEVPYRVLVAVSGGADSTALAHLCLSSFDMEMAIAHFHHHLRPGEADEDEAFVRDLAERLGVPYRRGDWNPVDRVTQPHSDRNLQAAARHARYEFLAKTAKDLAIPVLVTAHHQDDQVETVVFNLSRGGGTGAWHGIRPALQRQGIWILRPLLSFTKEDLLAYLNHLGEPHREDSSNSSRKYSRNRIRHDLLPEMHSSDAGFRETLLARSATAQFEEAHWLDVLERVKHESLFQSRCWTLPRKEFERMPEEGVFFCLRRLLWEFKDSDEGWYPISRKSLSAFFSLLNSKAEGEITFPQGIHVRLRRGTLILHKKS